MIFTGETMAIFKVDDKTIPLLNNEITIMDIDKLFIHTTLDMVIPP